ncbi:S41 family peptidase [Telluribacter sp. SYSU D00476]|uniref:S41 family peptidase n=1 Tax=Telluribacter sp. SYSU D00476 TaxID=2811430 RepID=UPI001FF24AC4|nr:S41 family peptidase [Telluribacter sp. SYSU D00476]
MKVKRAKRPSEHYYIGLYAGVGNPEFKNENDYFSMKYPDAGFRLLTLFRYWNIIQYYFPYRNLIEEDWKSVLEEFIPKFMEVKDELGYELAILELISRIHDTHAVIGGNIQVLLSYNGRRITPVKLTFVENAPVVTGYYDEGLGKETGLKNGDIITAVNGRPVEDIVKGKLKYTSASNYPTKLRNIAHNLLMSNDSTIAIEYNRNGRQENMTLKTFAGFNYRIHGSDTCFKLVSKDIAYINNETLQKRYLPRIWEEMKDTKGLIIDIRNYPTDFPIYDLSSYLIPKSTPFVKFSTGSIETPGLFTFIRTRNAGGGNNDHYKGKVVILINEISQSSSEFHTMAYRVHPHAVVVGSTTAGADGNVSHIILPGGIRTMISGIGVYYPDGKETQRVGIVPDIELKPTIQGIREGRDELMEKAIEIINGQ